VINGGLKVTDSAKERGAHLIKVKGGDVRLYRTRLEGPHVASPPAWSSAVHLFGSGDAAPDRAHACSVNESVILSSKAGVVLEGIGQRLLVRQSVVVAGTDAVVIRPGEACQGRANAQCTLDHATVAARSAMLRLGDPPNAAAVVISDPVVVQTRDCAFLSPFPNAKAGLLACEGAALSRGLLLWQSEHDAVDARVWYAVKRAEDKEPEKREVAGPWRRLWGSGIRSPRPDLVALQGFGARWDLDRLAVRQPDPPGADVRALLLPKR
jgi:hypothetical protein